MTVKKYYNIVIHDDIKLSLDDVLLVPKYSDIKSRLSTDISTVLVGNIKLGVPVVTAAMDTISESNMAIEIGRLGGASFLHRFASDKKIIRMVKDINEVGQLAIPSLGVRKDIVKWVGVLLENGASALSIDIAHGHSSMVLKTVDLIKSVYPECNLIAGNVATSSGVRDLISAGADAVKVFVGSGGVCTTRIATGFGVPTFSCLVDCVQEANKHSIPVIADGGLKTPGDYTKCLAAGASSCMTGSMFAGVKETPGREIKIKDKYFKEYRGMSSREAQEEFKGGLKDGVAAEGAALLVEMEGTAKSILDYITGGIRSGLTYCGAHNLKELVENAEFIRITSPSIIEGRPHKLTG